MPHDNDVDSSTENNLINDKDIKKPYVYCRMFEPPKTGCLIFSTEAHEISNPKKRKTRNSLKRAANNDNPFNLEIQQLPFNPDNSLYRPLKINSTSKLTLQDSETSDENDSLVPDASAFLADPSALEVATPGGTDMSSKRHMSVVVQSPDTKRVVKRLDIHFYSPERPEKFSYQAEKDVSALLKEKSETKTSGITHTRKRKSSDTPSKGGDDISVSLARQGTKRKKDQKQVMKATAKKVILNFIKENENQYDKEIIKRLKNLVKRARFEWAHAYGFGNSPLSFDPQTKSNLGATGKWINTFMMVLESVARDLAKHFPNAVVMNSLFKLLCTADNTPTDIVKKVHYSVTLTLKNKQLVILSNEVDALHPEDRSTLPSISDITQTNLVLDSLIKERPLLKL